MRTNYVLVDFENVQPKDLHLLREGEFRVLVFVGALQTKLPIDVVTAIQSLGANAEYVCIEKNGKNALDFHIAYYIGRLAERDPSAHFHIISKDTGFSPLIEHLKTKHIGAKLRASLSDIPFLRQKNGAADSSVTNVKLVVDDLTKRKASRPRTLKTLRSTVHALFKKELPESELDSLMNELVKQKIVTVAGTKISYNLPA